ncbi:C69 family dipeptidase [candidate division KSB1 bacterium]|nr:C69 family dipeptidase [candidate division KSB1 bacterium]
MQNRFIQLMLILGLCCLMPIEISYSCTNFLISKGASTDGSTMITYAADSHTLYGELYYMPAQKYLPGTMLDIYEWDTGKYLGQIKQVAETYSVVGNMNEHQVSIGETTYGGREELQDPKAIMDYGSLMYIALQRSKTAREAIKVITDLAAEYGYASSGETFSIADANEVWIMDFIGKGPENKGAVWVARRVPEGYVCAHANFPRIHQFPLNDPENCLYAKDVITFAREKGYFKGQDKDFSFVNAYSPPDYGGIRFCEARVWQMFRRVAPNLDLPVENIIDPAKIKPLPLWVKPEKKLSAHDVMELMRDHFEGTPLDLSKGLGAGPYSLPYRWRPLTWKVDSLEYLNERSTSTQQTGFSFVAQARSTLPNPIGGVLWFSVDDTYSTVYVPMYCGIREVPKSFAVGTGSFNQFTWESAFWVFNFVANYAYSRYSDMIVDIQKVQRELEGKFLAEQPAIDAAALNLYQKAPQLALDYLTDYSVRTGNETVQRWRKLGEALFVKYLDGNVKNELGKVTHPGYPEAWRRRIVKEDGEILKMKKLPGEKSTH